MEICRIQEVSSITKDIIVQQYNREKNIKLHILTVLHYKGSCSPQNKHICYIQV